MASSPDLAVHSSRLAAVFSFGHSTQGTALIETVCRGFALALDGIHGAGHWLRVRENGLRLAPLTGAEPDVVELFALLHDSQRQNDGWDLEHGHRAAEFLRTRQELPAMLSPPALERLLFACAHHTEGQTEAHITIQTCWDADRLDLGRVRIMPSATHLCTAAARNPEIMDWAYRRSRQWRRPAGEE